MPGILLFISSLGCYSSHFLSCTLCEVFSTSKFLLLFLSIFSYLLGGHQKHPLWHVVWCPALSLVLCLFGFSFLSISALYAKAWVISDSCAPSRLKPFFTVRSMLSGYGLSAPSPASLSAPSFPWISLWPFIHLNSVVAPLSLNLSMMALMSSALSIPMYLIYLFIYLFFPFFHIFC